MDPQDQALSQQVSTVGVGRLTYTEETGEYLRSRMRSAGFSEAEIARIDPRAADHFHSLSGGVPRALHREAWSDFERVLAVRAQPDFEQKRRREDWMGRPIEDDGEL